MFNIRRLWDLKVDLWKTLGFIMKNYKKYGYF